ncbi:MAG: SLBB domain-containing protein [Candidatus Ozemobacteraceae bacterium]
MFKSFRFKSIHFNMLFLFFFGCGILFAQSGMDAKQFAPTPKTVDPTPAPESSDPLSAFEGSLDPINSLEPLSDGTQNQGNPTAPSLEQAGPGALPSQGNPHIEKEIKRFRQSAGRKSKNADLGNEAKVLFQVNQEKPPIDEANEGMNDRTSRTGTEQTTNTSDADSGNLFGYDVFQRMGTQFAPTHQMALDPGYIVGPGDSFKITILGRDEIVYSVEIDIEGNIILPRIGKVPAAGLTFQELKQNLNDSFKKVIQDFELRVTPIRRRQIRVYVLGKVQTPGMYALDGFSTAYSALFAAGGPTQKATLRKIQLKRNNQNIAEIDLYDLLLYGNRSGDESLQEGDVIFVPPTGPRASITGAVKLPAIFEMKESEQTLDKLLNFAEGITPYGDVKALQIERVVAHSRKVVFSTEISNPQSLPAEVKKIGIQDLDVVRVYSFSPRLNEYVTLEGHVFEAGIRPWKSGMMLSDILDQPEKIKRDPFMEYGEILRESGPNAGKEIISFQLSDFLVKPAKNDIPLKPHDKIRVFAAAEMNENVLVSIEGEVLKPGKFPLLSSMTIRDLVYAAGGLKNGASPAPAEFTRHAIKNGVKQVERRVINIQKALLNDNRENVKLQPLDHLIVRTVPDWRRENSVTLSGEFTFPGKYSFEPGERLSTVIKRAGGFTSRAYLKGSIFTRQSVLTTQKTQLSQIIRDAQLEKSLSMQKNLTSDLYDPADLKNHLALAEQNQNLLQQMEKMVPLGRVVIQLSDAPAFSHSDEDLVLETGDSLVVPQKPTIVLVEGAVKNPVSLVWKPNGRMADYLQKTGGFKRFADSRNVCLVRADGTTLSSDGRPARCFFATKVEPGDVIWVPVDMRMAPPSKLKPMLNMTQMLANLAVTILAIDRTR